MAIMDDRRYIEMISEVEEKILRTLGEMISIRTINPPGINYPDFIKYTEILLKEWKIEYKIIQGPAENEDRTSIIGKIGGNNRKSVHFHGHYDVVPAENDAQFKPYLKDGRFYGRGSSDMKGGIVSMLYALKFFNENRYSLGGTLTFSLVPDEETGGEGGMRYLSKNGFLPLDGCAGMIMPEPSGGVIWNASKGALTMKVSIEGKYAHIALADDGVNAFENMTLAAGSLIKLKDKISKRITSLPVIPEGAKKSVMLIGGKSGSGMNFNTVPDKAWFTIDRRFNPEENLDDVKQEIIDLLEKEKSLGIGLTYEILQEGESSLSSHENPLGRALAEAACEITGESPRFELCPGLLETRFFSKYEIPAYAYGPGLLEVSHGPEEFVDVKSLVNCTSIFISAINKFFV